MEITWDEAKRLATLAERGLDFADAALVFAGRTMTLPDERRGLRRTALHHRRPAPGRFIVMVWTPRDGGRPIISMRYGHVDEESYWREQMD